METIQVFIADDHAVLRAGLRLLIDSQDDMEIVGEAGDFDTMLIELRRLRPDVVTLDLSMPGGLGLKAIDRIREAVPQSRVVVLTMHDDPAYLRTSLAMGASGYVVKSAADTELIGAIRAVHHGRVFVDARSAAMTPDTNKMSTVTEKDLGIDKLSPRERMVLSLVAQGHTNQAIADRLDVSVKTVESYRGRVMTKLSLRNRADLMRFAIAHGMLQDGASEPLI